MERVAKATADGLESLDEAQSSYTIASRAFRRSEEQQSFEMHCKDTRANPGSSGILGINVVMLILRRMRKCQCQPQIRLANLARADDPMTKVARPTLRTSP